MARGSFLAEHPEVPSRLAELDEAIRREDDLERQQSWARVLHHEQVRQLGMLHELDTGLGIDH